MTIEELTGCPADRWDSLNDEQLLKIAEENDWLKITRPDLANPEGKSALKSSSTVTSRGSAIRQLTVDVEQEQRKAKLEAAKQQALALGIDISSVLDGLKKKRK